MNYIYDKSFEGFLTCVYEHWYTEKAEAIFPEADYQLDLTRYASTVETDYEKAARVFDAIQTRISKWDAKRVYQVFCSCEPEKEIKLLRYIAYGFRKGSKIRLLHSDPIVKPIETAERRVGAETHRLLGLIRFEEVQIEGRLLLYAKIEPDNDVLEFLSDHFADRLKNEAFIIHDLRREKALFAFGRKWAIAKMTSETPCSVSGKERNYAALWKDYFDVMATKERIDEKRQRRFMPVRYWKHLTEL